LLTELTYWLARCIISDTAEVETPTRLAASTNATPFQSPTITWHSVPEELKRNSLDIMGLLNAEGNDRRYFFSNLLTGQEYPDIFISNGC